MPDHIQPQLGRLVGVPMLTIGLLAAVLVWELEHVSSIAVAGIVALSGVAAAMLVARRVRVKVDELASHYEALLQTADEQSRRAEAANRVKDEFLSTLSHELRTPLNAVLGWARLLATGKLDAAQTVKAVQAIERAGWAQSRLVEDLLDVSRIVRGTLQITPRMTLLQPIVEQAVHALHPAADAKRIAVHLEVESAIGAISVDPDRLRQIVWNLLSNAIKFTPSGGHVRVVVSSDGELVRLSVSDTGIGFNPDIAAHLFERFRQGDSGTTRQFGGLGLGLGIVRHLAELHGGTVTAESAGEHRGSVFTVRLPVVSAPNGVAAPADRLTLRGTSVLVVDDDPQALELARSALEAFGASVTIAKSARDAVERFARAPFTVIVSDLRMPDEDGLELIGRLRAVDAARGRRTPAAALTALARNDDRARAIAAGYELHVVKPIDPFELAGVVERLAHSTAEPATGEGKRSGRIAS